MPERLSASLLFSTGAHLQPKSNKTNPYIIRKRVLPLNESFIRAILLTTVKPWQLVSK
jgi:hypothetical protein